MSKPLNILVFAGYFFPYRGGYVESLYGLAKRLVLSGHSVTIVTCNISKGAAEETIEGVKIIRLPGWHLLGGTYPIVALTPKAFFMGMKLMRLKVDVVSTQTRFFVTSFLGALYAMVRRRPLIHTERGAYHSVVRSRFIDFASRVIDHTMGWFVVRRAKRNVGVSKAACEFIRHLGGRNVTLIPNGVEIPPALSDAERGRLLEKWGFSSPDKMLLFVGRLVYAKGVQDVLAILPALIKKEPRLIFTVVGDGPYRSRLEEKVAQLGLKDRVRFLGLLSSHEVIECMQLSHFFVNPSHSEGLPRSVLEAASNGLPIVASNVGGTADIIVHQKNGLLFDLNQKNDMESHLRLLLSDSKLSARLGKSARMHVQVDFSWPTILRSYVDLFHEVVQ